MEILPLHRRSHMNFPEPARSRLKHLFLAAACGVAFTSCSIPVTGSGSLPKAAASLQIGKTTYPELEARLGKPSPTDRKGNRHVANWVSSGVGLGAGTIIGTNSVNFHSLGVEYDQQGVVRRAVSHSNQRKSTLATPFQTSHVAGATRDPQRFASMKRVGQIEAELGPPQFKRITLDGESWLWVGYPGASGNGVLIADIDRSGRILKTNLK
jgi:hypothetical protein